MAMKRLVRRIKVVAKVLRTKRGRERTMNAIYAEYANIIEADGFDKVWSEVEQPDTGDVLRSMEEYRNRVWHRKAYK